MEVIIVSNLNSNNSKQQMQGIGLHSFKSFLKIRTVARIV